ncbi:MAG: hypothetical protein L0332_03320 [Chloroflexi bacterium]|nr:hypothetical protein [Chloroflexota bacterium]MCI0579674.1 hypothetical protein [Chloroflexota bacterium]MCI0645886.1 hypothetical protein [Chloroflexota bacterium]MCI0725741.1 hypothetical protein [Chloroflexota bacterium]
MTISPNGHRDLNIVILIPRGEAVRNVIYTDTLPVLSQRARLTLLSVITDERFVQQSRAYVADIRPIKEEPEHKVVRNFRHLLYEAHFRWIDSGVAHYNRELNKLKANTWLKKARLLATQAAVRPLANRPALETLSKVENYLTYRYRTTAEFDRLFRELQPDLVYNASHIHGVNGGGIAVRVARAMGIPTAGFIFSWDNLTSRSRIFEPYDHYLMWNERMRQQLIGQYPFLKPEQVVVTGTPQFDFHFKPEFWLSREELCRRIGADPSRPFILYTTAVGPFFPEEYRTVELVIRLLKEIDLPEKPQLVVRIYPKAPDPKMLELAQQNIPDVIFPPMLWDLQWFTPSFEDQPIYTSLLRHCALGINAASTVSLELMMHDKPVINLGFDPPGSQLPHALRFSKHITFDHYRPVAESGGVMVAWSPKEMGDHLIHGLSQPQAGSQQRQQFIRQMFGDTLDGQAGRRVAEQLVHLAESRKARDVRAAAYQAA